MKNEKAMMDNLFKIILWVVLFLIALGGLYYLLRFLTG
jgi:flagellar basal body-associated protein FliL